MPPRNPELEALRVEIRRLEERLSTLEAFPSPVLPQQPPPVRETRPVEEPEAEEIDERDRQEAAKLVKKGVQAARKGNYVAAVADLAQAAILDGENQASLFFLSYLALSWEGWEQALGYMRRAMGKDPEWLSRAPNPLFFFRSPLEYRRFVALLEAYVRSHPADADAKTLLAFQYFFLKATLIIFS